MKNKFFVLTLLLYSTRFAQLQDRGGEEEAGEPLHCHRAHFQAPDGQVGQFFRLKVHKNENFFGFDFEFCTTSLLVMHK